MILCMRGIGHELGKARSATGSRDRHCLDSASRRLRSHRQVEFSRFQPFEVSSPRGHGAVVLRSLILRRCAGPQNLLMGQWAEQVVEIGAQSRGNPHADAPQVGHNAI